MIVPLEYKKQSPNFFESRQSFVFLLGKYTPHLKKQLLCTTDFIDLFKPDHLFPLLFSQKILGLQILFC